MDSKSQPIQEPPSRQVDFLAMTPSALVGALGKWTAGEGPVYRRLARALEAAMDRGELEPGARLPAERVLARGPRALAHHGRGRLRGSASRRAGREPAGERNARARVSVARPGAAPERGSFGFVPPPPRLSQPRRGRRRHDRVPRRAPSGARHAAEDARPRRRTVARRARARSRVSPAGAAGAAPGDRAPPREAGGCRRPRSRSW